MDRGFVPSGTKLIRWAGGFSQPLLRGTGGLSHPVLGWLYWDCAELDLSQGSYHIWCNVCGCVYLLVFSECRLVGFVSDECI